jgi:RNase P/RNase MRP subunit p30
MEKDKYKFNLILTEGAKEQLEVLQKRTQAASFAEVIRRALAVYDALQEHTSTGWELVLREKSGKKTEKPVLLV